MTAEPSCILLVEADLLVRHPLAEYLRECGYRVFEAAGATEARQHFNNPDTPPDSIIDIVLADATGASAETFALAAWLHANHPGVEIILAGTVTKAAEKAGDLCEDGPAIVKPYDHNAVLNHIRRQLAARGRNK